MSVPQSVIDESVVIEKEMGTGPRLLAMLWRDKFALIALLFLVLLVFGAVFGPMLLGEQALAMNLKLRNAPPFALDNGWLYLFGGDALGRPILPRIIVASQNTLGIAAATVPIALIIGAKIGRAHV